MTVISNRIFVFLMILIFLSLNSFAEIVDNTQYGDNYYIGDEINIQGSVKSATKGLFQIMIDCGQTQNLIYSTSVTPNLEKQYSQKYYLTESNYDKDCQVVHVLNSNDGTQLDQLTSPTFSVSGDYILTFEIAKDDLKLGQSTQIDVTARKKDGPFKGTMTMIAKKDGQDLIVESLESETGQFSYKFTANGIISAGTYSISFILTDLYLHKETYSNQIVIQVYDDLKISIEPTKKEYLPGESVFSLITVNDHFGSTVDHADVSLILEAKSHSYEVTEPSAKLKYQMPKTISSGLHTITVEAVDDEGNKGYSEFDISVIPLPTELTIEIVDRSLVPGDILEFSPELYDQAGESIRSAIDLEIIPPKGRSIVLASPANAAAQFNLGQSAVPGEWIIEAESGILKDSTTFSIAEVRAISIDQNDNIVTIKNKGNIEYNDKISFFAYSISGSKHYFSEKVSVKPNKTVDFDLSTYLKNDSYTIYTIEEKVIQKFIEDVVIQNPEDIQENDLISLLTSDETDSAEYPDDSSSSSLSISPELKNLLSKSPVSVEKSVEIEDHRPFYYKTGDSLSKLMGNSIKTVAGIGQNGTFLALIIFLVLIAVVILNKTSIESLIRRIDHEKPDSGSQISDSTQTVEADEQKVAVNVVTGNNATPSRPLKKSGLVGIPLITQDDTIQAEDKQYHVLFFKKPTVYLRNTSNWAIKQIIDSFYTDISSLLSKADYMDDKSNCYIIFYASTQNSKDAKTHVFETAKNLLKSVRRLSDTLKKRGVTFRSSVGILTSDIMITESKYSKFYGLIPLSEHIYQSKDINLIMSKDFKDMFDREYNTKPRDDIKSNLEFCEWVE
ncbi:hypothetical protein K9M79_00790 [Candidatus Woesearchaeota archaeon]|nr:hypothetical protein [Candidatus Woesearchaeota archaeon]